MNKQIVRVLKGQNRNWNFTFLKAGGLGIFQWDWDSEKY